MRNTKSKKNLKKSSSTKNKNIYKSIKGEISHKNKKKYQKLNFKTFRANSLTLDVEVGESLIYCSVDNLPYLEHSP